MVMMMVVMMAVEVVGSESFPDGLDGTCSLSKVICSVEGLGSTYRWSLCDFNLPVSYTEEAPDLFSHRGSCCVDNHHVYRK